MTRPKKLRTVGPDGKHPGFRPIGRPVAGLLVENLCLDELEALRLSDLEGLYQEAAAEQMRISRPTLSRILSKARTTVTRAIIEERLLVIGDGPVVTRPRNPIPCPIHGEKIRRGRGCRCRRGTESARPKPIDKEGNF